MAKRKTRAASVASKRAPTKRKADSRPRTKLAECVDELRGTRTQAEIADAADMSAGGLSRLLAGDREPQMGHLLSLAAALKTSVLELARQAEVEHVLTDWVRREEFERLDTARDAVQREAEDLAEELQEEQAENKRLSDLVEQRSKELIAVRERSRTLENVATEKDRLAREVGSLTAEVETLTGDVKRKMLLARRITAQRDDAREQAHINENKLRDLYVRAQELERELKAATGKAAASSVLAGFVGLGAGAWLLGRKR